MHSLPVEIYRIYVYLIMIKSPIISSEARAEV